MSPKPLEIIPKGDREIIITRMFNASPAVIWRCHTEPALVRRWLLGPAGWTMPVCEIDLRVGGAYRYEWAHADGRTMGMGGVHRAIEAPHKIVATQLFDEDWTGGETVSTLELLSVGDMTKCAQTIVYASTEARQNVLQSPMAMGMEAGYKRLDELLAEPM